MYYSIEKFDCKKLFKKYLTVPFKKKSLHVVKLFKILNLKISFLNLKVISEKVL